MTAAARRLRILNLHSFRTSAAIFKEQFARSGLDKQLDDLVELVFVDAPIPATGPAQPDVTPFFQGPYYEWWNAQKDDGHTEYVGWETTLAFVTNALRTQGPFDGLLGFSQGGMVASVLMGLQQQGLALTDIPPLEFCIIVAAGSPGVAFQAAFSEKITCPALLLWGTRDPVQRWCETLPERFEAPLVMKHGRGHVIPQLEQSELDVMRSFLHAQQQNCSL